METSSNKKVQFKVSELAVKERNILLSEKFKTKMKEEEKASGIECHLSRLEKALEEIAAAAAEDTVENYRKKTDDAKAAEMRNRGCRKPERNTGKAAAFFMHIINL
ncbi:hypothetical protein pdam_00018655 [Pocillopora damicornis]|uniref:Uncharacterized protein n=1 Tax=Pocillopora damicornis TaxID=46731 RepID=A0A3M6U1Y8_POCDA|nr:hypothetical protein pdam_00018655 [Pocillopora damicornis]